MKLITSIAALALVAFAAGCENTDQPELTEAFSADLTDGTSTDTDTTEATDEVTPEQSAKQSADEAAMKDRRNQAHSADRVAKKPLKAE